MDIVEFVMALAWTAIFLMLAVGGIKVLSQRYFARPKLPFFAMLERRGLTYAQLENAAGPEAIAQAMHRCVDCHARFDCGWRAVDCPNAPLFRSAARRAPATG